MQEIAPELQYDIEEIKANETMRNEFIAQYKPFIASFTSECARRYVTYGVDEELSIALLAFNEAIDRFNGKGNFLLYAKMVIKTRLIDYFKSSFYRENRKSFGLYDEEDNEIDELKQDAIERYAENYEQSVRVAEIQELNRLLAQYQITFQDLVKGSPKHLLTRKLVNSPSDKILDQPDLVAQIKEAQTLPLKEIEKNFLIPRKKLEVYRKYIIAGVILAASDLDTLKDYLPFNK